MKQTIEQLQEENSELKSTIREQRTQIDLYEDFDPEKQVIVPNETEFYRMSDQEQLNLKQ